MTEQIERNTSITNYTKKALDYIKTTSQYKYFDKCDIYHQTQQWRPECKIFLNTNTNEKYCDSESINHCEDCWKYVECFYPNEKCSSCQSIKLFGKNVCKHIMFSVSIFYNKINNEQIKFCQISWTKNNVLHKETCRFYDLASLFNCIGYKLELMFKKRKYLCC